MSKPELAQFAKQDGTGRAYKHPFRTDGQTGKPLLSPSVTTILNLVDKPALMQWAADRTLDWAIDNASVLFTKDTEGVIRSGRYRWTDVRNERAEVGTGIHETIEMLHTGGWDYPELDDEQKRIMQQWEKLQERYVFTPSRSEFTVWGDLDNWVGHWAGTADGLWSIEDRQTGEYYEDVVIDLKTSKNIWPEHWLQLSALASADVIMEKKDDGTWVEYALPKTPAVAIIHLREDKAAVHLERDEDLINLRYNQFKSLRSVWHFKSEVAQFTKDREKTKAMAF